MHIRIIIGITIMIFLLSSFFVSLVGQLKKNSKAITISKILCCIAMFVCGVGYVILS